MEKFFQRLSYITFDIIHTGLKSLPYPFLSALMRCLATVAYVLKIRRKVVEANIRSALRKAPDRRTIFSIYTFFGELIATGLSPEKAAEHYKPRLKLLGFEQLKNALEDKRGAILLTGHVGTFLLGAFLLKKSGFPLTIAGKKMRNEASNRLISKIYDAIGDNTVLVSGFKNDPTGAKKLLRALNENRTVIVLNDQDAGPDGYWSNFFGLPTSIPKGPSHLAHKTGARVLTGFVYWENHCIVAEIQSSIKYPESSLEEAEKTILDEYSKRLEEVVRKHPEQYFWFHKKWKSYPEVAKLYS